MSDLLFSPPKILTEDYATCPQCLVEDTTIRYSHTESWQNGSSNGSSWEHVEFWTCENCSTESEATDTHSGG